MPTKSELPDPDDRYYLRDKDWTVFGWNDRKKEDAPKKGEIIPILGKLYEVQDVEFYYKMMNPKIPGFGVAVKGKHL